MRTCAYVSIADPRTFTVTRPERSSSSKKAIFPPPSLKSFSRYPSTIPAMLTIAQSSIPAQSETGFASKRASALSPFK